MRFLVVITICLSMCLVPTFAQDGDDEKKKFGWFNSTELGLAVTEGNSNTDSFALNNILRHVTERGRFRLRIDGVRTNTSDDWFREVNPGFTWLPGEEPPDFGDETTLVKPSKDPDVEKYAIDSRYERKITDKFTWNAGLGWDRDVDAGIINRYQGFGGVGNIWKAGDKLNFTTSYALSFTNREEETPDPLKDDQFMGARLTAEFDAMIVKSTKYELDFKGNSNLTDTSDYTLDMMNAISVSINDWLALKVSLQWLYNNEPALEDIDLLAFIVLRDPDGIPGSGDEFFETVPGSESNSAEIEIEEVRERKEQLDTVFRTTLVINF